MNDPGDLPERGRPHSPRVTFESWGDHTGLIIAMHLRRSSRWSVIPDLGRSPNFSLHRHYVAPLFQTALWCITSRRLAYRRQARGGSQFNLLLKPSASKAPVTSLGSRSPDPARGPTAAPRHHPRAQPGEWSPDLRSAGSPQSGDPPNGAGKPPSPCARQSRAPAPGRRTHLHSFLMCRRGSAVPGPQRYGVSPQEPLARAVFGSAPCTPRAAGLKPARGPSHHGASEAPRGRGFYWSVSRLPRLLGPSIRGSQCSAA